MGIQKLYLQLIIQDKEEEINEIISQFDDYLFCLRSLKTSLPYLNSLSPNYQHSYTTRKTELIFTEITSGAKIEDVAKRCGISYDGICRRYKVISLRLQENMGFLTEYKKTITNQDLEIERLWIENRNMEYELRRLYKRRSKRSMYRISPITYPRSLKCRENGYANPLPVSP